MHERNATPFIVHVFSKLAKMDKKKAIPDINQVLPGVLSGRMGF